MDVQNRLTDLVSKSTGYSFIPDPTSSNPLEGDIFIVYCENGEQVELQGNDIVYFLRALHNSSENFNSVYDMVLGGLTVKCGFGKAKSFLRLNNIFSELTEVESE